MIHPNASDTTTVRSVFVIGPDKKVKLTITYPQSTGRNFEEILRVIDSLQLTANHKVSTPVNWKQGDDVIIIPAVSDEEAAQRFPDGWTALTPYLRLVPQPTFRRERRSSAFAGRTYVSTSSRRPSPMMKRQPRPYSTYSLPRMNELVR